MAWKELGYLASPNLYLGWPDPDTRNENVASLGSDPLFSHANGVGWRISLPNNLSFVLGGGWLTRSPVYPYQEETNGTSISQEYGLIKPNNHAMPATAIVEIKNGSVVVQHEAAGDIYDKHSAPVFLYASNGSIRVMNADEYREVVIDQKKQLPDGCIIQIAFALSVSQEGLDSLNTASRNPVNRPIILDSLQKDLEPLNLPSLDIAWVIHATTSEGRQLVVLPLNRDKQSERAAGEYKIIAGINTLLESANLKPNERFTSLSIIHTGQQGSTGDTVITRGEAQSKTVNNTSASLQEFLSKLSK